MSQTLKFSKMHGLGNDFVVIDGISQAITIDEIPVQMLADRHIGIGFDQLLLIERSNRADFLCRIFNADGSESEQCGNGMRCIARFVHEKNLNQNEFLTIETMGGIVNASLKNYDDITVEIGPPLILPSHEFTLVENQPNVRLFLLSIGNPHAILFVTSLADTPVSIWGSLISNHSFFPNGVNVGFVEIVDAERIRLRTFERGVGLTYACGSNACAAVVAGIQSKLLSNTVQVELPKGQLCVSWAGEQTPVKLTGPASWVFDGEIIISMSAS